MRTLSVHHPERVSKNSGEILGRNFYVKTRVIANLLRGGVQNPNGRTSKSESVNGRTGFDYR
jgi:hypothetical protein